MLLGASLRFPEDLPFTFVAGHPTSYHVDNRMTVCRFCWIGCPTKQEQVYYKGSSFSRSQTF